MGVDVLDRYDVVLLYKCFEWLLGVVVGVFVVEFVWDEVVYIWFVVFYVVDGDVVVVDVWVSDGYDLFVVWGIGYDFLVVGYGGVEYYFIDGFVVVFKSVVMVYGVVF